MSHDPVSDMQRDIERLRAAFRELASRYTEPDMHGDIGLQTIVDAIATKHGITHLMRQNDTPEPHGWSGYGL